jgi:hypothetical protein
MILGSPISSTKKKGSDKVEMRTEQLVVLVVQKFGRKYLAGVILLLIASHDTTGPI